MNTQKLSIKRAYVRHYSDNGQTKAYVEWNDGARTEGGFPLGLHLQALFDRALQTGVKIENENW